MSNKLTKWRLAFKVLPFVAAAMVLKFALHRLDWEVISLNALLPGLLAATVFLLGFLISGVLSDYKESEKLPGELAVSLGVLADELGIAHGRQPSGISRAALAHALGLAERIEGWFHERHDTPAVMEHLSGLNQHFLRLEASTPPPFITRMKQEQSALRRVLIRIDMIRHTSFVSSGYAIAEITATLVITGFILARIDPFYESLFFIGLIAFLLTYMLALIRDLDDPFEYGPGQGGGDEVSLKPVEDALADLRCRFLSLPADGALLSGPPAKDSPASSSPPVASSRTG
jgi:hypothetical protein